MGLLALVGRLQPSLDNLETAVAELQVTIRALGESLTPIGRLADRLPGSGRAAGRSRAPRGA